MSAASPTPAATPAEPPPVLVVKSSKDLAIEEIERGLRILHPPGDLVPFEIRAKIPSPYKDFWKCGYFNDFSLAAKTAFELSKDENALGVYATFNAIHPDLFCRLPNVVKKAESMTTDAHVMRRRYLCADLDPIRLSGIPSTNAEQDLARLCAADVESWLCDTHGWPHPILGSTGNGYSMLFRIDEPNDTETTTCITKVLEAIKLAMASHAGVDVDTQVSNASRMVRVFGTKNRKGGHTDARPHRINQLFEPPDPWGVVSTSQLAAIAALAPPEQLKVAPSATAASASSTPKSGGIPRVMFDRWLADIGRTFTIKSKPGQTVYVLDECPFNPDHRHGKAAFFQQDGGRPGFKCQSDKCSKLDWHAYIRQFGKPEPHHYDPPLGTRKKAAAAAPVPSIAIGDRVRPSDRKNVGEVVSISGDTANVHFVSPEGEEATKPFGLGDLVHEDGRRVVADPDRPPITLISSADFAATVYDHKYLIKDILVAEQPMVVGGRSKTLKTSLMIDLALSLGSGSEFLGKFAATKATVAVLSAESGEATLQETARRICRTKGIDFASLPVYWGFQLPQLTTPEDLDVLADLILEHCIEVLIIDPLYLCLLAGDAAGIQTGNLFHIGPILLRLTQIAKRVNCTVILCHHFRKNSNAPDRYGIPELEELSQSGCAEFARQWLLVGRSREYEPGSGRHELIVNAGGSAGHSGCYSVSVDEGEFVEGVDRKWDVEAKTLGDAKKEKENRQAAIAEQTEDQHRRKVIEALRQFPEGQCKSALSTLAGLNNKYLGKALLAMKKRGEVNCGVVDGRRGEVWNLTETGKDAI